MSIYILFYMLFAFIIKDLSICIEFKNNLKKYGKIITSDSYIIFDSSDFKIDEEIYFKITADSFHEEYIQYKFFDDVDSINDVILGSLSFFKKVDPLITENGSDESVTKYYTIKKSERDLGSLEGKYIVIVFDCNGNVLIENTEINEGDNSSWISIIVVLLFIAGICILCYCCCCKKKKKDANLTGANGATTNQVYTDNNNQNNNMNMNNINVNSGNNVDVYNKNNNNINSINYNYMNNNYKK